MLEMADCNRVFIHMVERVFGLRTLRVELLQ